MNRVQMCLFVAGGGCRRRRDGGTDDLLKAGAVMNASRYDRIWLPLAQLGEPDPRPLTSRQIAVLQCVREGLTNTEAAARLGVSRNTIKWHLKGLSRTLGAKNRCAAVYRAQVRGLI